MDNYDIAFVSLAAKILLFFVCIFVYYERKYITEYDNNIWKFLILFLILIFSVFYNMDFDYYRFQNNFYQVTKRDDLEKIYLLLFSFFPNYSLFRLGLWGFGLFIFCKSLKSIEANSLLGLIFFSFYYINTFSYARSSVACLLAFYGIILFYNNSRYFIYGPIMILSCFMHKSIFFFLLIFYIAYYINIKWKVIAGFVVTMPILAYILSSIFKWIVNNIDMGLASTSMNVILSGNNIKGFSLAYLLNLSPSILFFFIFLTYYHHFKNYLSEEFEKITKGLILLVVISCTFLFIPDGYMNLLFKRYINMALVPLFILATYMCSIFGVNQKVRYLTYVQALIMVAYGIHQFVDVDFSLLEFVK